MSNLLPAYKLTIFAPISGGLELTPLTPTAGAIHSDAFQVASIQGVGGFHPYLDLPKGRKNTYDPTTGRTTNQDLTFRLLDMKSGTSGGNLQRWVTAFLGDSSGSLNLMNRLVEVWESLDAGVTWNAFYKGRISNTQLDDPLWYSISIKSLADDLNIEAFKYRPASGTTGYALTSLIPMGLSDQYGPFTASVGLAATFTVSGGSGSLACDVNNYANGISTVLVGYLQRGIKTLSDAQQYIARLFGQDTSQRITLADPSGSAGSNLRLLVTDGTTHGEYAAGDVVFELNNHAAYRVRTLQCSELLSGDPGHTLLSTFSGKQVTCRIIPNFEPLSDTNPLFISAKHPGQLIRELASGNYGFLDTVSRTPVRQVINFDSASFAAFESSSYYDNPRFRITKPWKINDFIEKNLCIYGLGYRVDYVVSGSHVISQLGVFDSRIPASSSFATLSVLSDTDIAGFDNLTWQLGTPASSITVKYYTEYAKTVDKKTVASNDVYDIDPWLIAEADTSLIEFIPQNVASTTKTINVDALGSRSPSTHLYTDFYGRQAFIMDTSHTDIAHYQYERFGNGPPSISLKCRRTTTVNGLKLGQWLLLEVSVIPDPTSHQRGGVRLCQVTEKSEDGLFVNLSLMDSGTNVLNLAPSIGTVVAAASIDGTNCVNVPVTAISGQKLLLQMAEVASGSARPAEIDPSWFSVVRRDVTTGSAVNYLVTGLRANKTYWFRARGSTLDDSLSSVWSYAAAGYTVAALTAPTSLTYSNITSTSVRLSWDNAGDNASSVQISLASPSSSALIPISIIYPGSTFFDATGLSSASADNPYLAGVAHVNGGATSTTPTVSFYLSSSAATCPAIAGFRVFTEAYLT